MDLDDRAHRAADSLRRQVEPTLDLSSARSSIAAGTAARRSHRRRAGLAGSAVAIVAVLAVFAAIAGTGGSGDGKVATDDGKRSTDAADSANAAAILGAMPRGPLDGKASYKLPVLAKPQSGLSDGDTITVYGTSFEPNDGLGIVQCSAEADIDNAGIGACQLASTPSGRRPRLTADERRQIDDYVASLGNGARWDDPADPPPQPPETPGLGQDPEGDGTYVQPSPEEQQLYDDYGRVMDVWTNAGGEYPDTFGAVTYADADADGSVVATFVVHRFITTPDGDRIDCASGPERCLIGMGAISNYDRSGGTYIDFADAPPFPEPQLAVDPAGDPAGTFTAGQQVTAQVTGSMPERQVRAKQCVADQCQKLTDGTADVDGNVALAVALQPSIVDDVTGEQIACEDRCVLRVTGIGTAGASSAPEPDPIELRFTSADPSVSPTAVPTNPQDPPVPGPATTAPETTAPASTDVPACGDPVIQPCAMPPATIPGSAAPSSVPTEPCNDTPDLGTAATCVPTTQQGG